MKPALRRFITWTLNAGKASGFSLAWRQESTARRRPAPSVRSYLPLAAGPGDSAAFDRPHRLPWSSPRAPASRAEGPGVASRWWPCSCEVAQPSERTQAERRGQESKPPGLWGVRRRPEWRSQGGDGTQRKTHKKNHPLSQFCPCSTQALSHRPSRRHVPQTRGPSCPCGDFSFCHDCCWWVQTGKPNEKK